MNLFNLKIELIILDCFVSYGLSLIFQAVVVQNELFIQCQVSCLMYKERNNIIRRA